MHALSTVVFLVAVAYASAGLIGAPLLGAPIDTAAVVQGPSGSIVRSGLGIGAPALLAGPAVAPLGLGLAGGLALAVPAGSGLEGQWIPDINEKLYDDGSYKPHVYGL